MEYFSYNDEKYQNQSNAVNDHFFTTFDGNDDAVSIEVADPNLDSYSFYPKLFIVDSNFCVKK